DREDQGDTETLEDLGHFEEKVGSFDFLFRGSPCDIVRDQMSENSLAKMDRETTKEDEAAMRISHSTPHKRSDLQEGNPHNVFKERSQEALVSQSIHENRIGKVTTDGEHKADTDPNLETAKVVSVRRQLPTEQEVVEQSQDE
ncbi:2772_t:CDS:1, partial [Acaulospora colombiana]